MRDIYDNWRGQFRAQYATTVRAKCLFEIAANNSNKAILFRQRSRLGHPLWLLLFFTPSNLVCPRGPVPRELWRVICMYNKTAGSPAGWREKCDPSVRTAIRKDETIFPRKCIFTGFWETCTSKRTTLRRLNPRFQERRKKERIFYSSLDITFKVQRVASGYHISSALYFYSDKYIPIREINTHQRNPLRFLQ